MITIYNIQKAYTYPHNMVYYQVNPYSLKGVIRNHFKFYNGFESLIPFLLNSRLTEKQANKVRNKKNQELGWEK